MSIIFLKSHKINGKEYKKGDPLKVHKDTADDLVSRKIAKYEKKEK